jgi:hypothetical protein
MGLKFEQAKVGTEICLMKRKGVFPIVIDIRGNPPHEAIDGQISYVF